MNIEKDVSSSPIMTEGFFPDLKQNLDNQQFKPIKLISNMYSVELNKSITFSWFMMKFIKNEDFEKYQEDPLSVEAPFPEDSRELIYTVIWSNWKELKKLLGYWFPTGFTLFTLGKTNF